MNWDEEFTDLVGSLGRTVSDLELNRLIWRLNEASMFLSRVVQYRGLGIDYPFPEEALEYLAPVGVLSSQISRVLEEAEGSLVEKCEENNIEWCLECVENDLLSDWGDHDSDESDED